MRLCATGLLLAGLMIGTAAARPDVPVREFPPEMAAMRPFAASLLLLLGTGTMLAQAPPGDDIDRLIAQLTHQKYAERVAAMKALEAKGEAALPALRKAAEKGDLELQRRATLVIELIETRLAVAPLLSGSKVRLVFKDVLILDAVADLREKLGFRVDVEGDRVPLHNRKITLDTGEVTFWQALTQFCQAAGLTERKTPPTNAPGPRGISYRLALTIGKNEPAPTTFAGPVRLKILPPGDHKAAFMMEVSPEPRMPWQGTRVLRLTKIVDQMGQLLPLPDPYLVPQFDGPPEDKLLLPGTVFAPEVLPVRLPAAVKPGVTLKEIHGTLTADAQASRKLTVIKNLSAAKGKSFRINNFDDALKVVNLQRDGDRLQLRLRIDGQLAAAISLEKFPDIGGPRMLRSASFMLLDLKGQPWKLIGQQPTVGSEDNGDVFVVVELAFQKHGKQDEPAQLVVSGAVTVPVEIPFAFRDVVLPK
jgi:hypothetical protein